MKRKSVIELISALFVLLFIDVGLSKLLDNHSFQAQLGQQPIPNYLIPLIAIPIPTLIFPRTRKVGLIAATFLMLLFTGYNIYLLNYGGQLPCGCGGIFKKMGWRTHLVVNCAMTIFGIYAVFFSLRNSLSNFDENNKYKTSAV